MHIGHSTSNGSLKKLTFFNLLQEMKKWRMIEKQKVCTIESFFFFELQLLSFLTLLLFSFYFFIDEVVSEIFTKVNFKRRKMSIKEPRKVFSERNEMERERKGKRIDGCIISSLLVC
jgi:hypothetical protein